MNQYRLLIEELIALKDSHRDELDLREIIAIDRVCNVLEGIEDNTLTRESDNRNSSHKNDEETIPIEYFIRKEEAK